MFSLRLNLTRDNETLSLFPRDNAYGLSLEPPKSLIFCVWAEVSADMETLPGYKIDTVDLVAPAGYDPDNLVVVDTVKSPDIQPLPGGQVRVFYRKVIEMDEQFRLVEPFPLRLEDLK